MGLARSVTLAALVLLAPCPARAQLCAAQALAGGPLWLGTGSGEGGPGRADFGQITSACPGTDAALRLRGELLIDRPDYYGAIVAAATVRGRWQLGARWTASGALDLATYRFVANAVVASAALDIGPATLGLQRTFTPMGIALAPFGRLLLPIDSARRHGALWGIEAGLALGAQLRPRLSLQGGVSLPVTLAAVGGVGHLALGPTAQVEVVVAARPWLALGLGAGSRAVLPPALPSAETPGQLRAVSLRPSVRLAFARGFGAALAADIPIAGRDRTDATVALFASWAPGVAGAPPP